MANDEEQSDPFDPTLIDPNYYEGLAQEFISKVGRLNSFTKHPPSVGTYHEEIIRSMLNDILPARFSVKTGFVFVETGAVSRQIDILIIDESQPSSYFFKVGQFAVVHPRAVACAIEVKTKLDKRSFLEAVQNIYQFQLTCEAVVPPAPIVTTIVFAFDSVNLTGQTMDRWYKSIDVPDKVQYYPMFVLALNKGAITLLAKRKPAHWGHYLVIPEEQAKQWIGGTSR